MRRLVLFCVLLAACGSPSAEVVAAEHLIEEQLADTLELVLDASCQETAATDIACTATTPDGEQVKVSGIVGADEIEVRATNVVTRDQLASVRDGFASVRRQLGLPAGRLDCGDRSRVADDANRFECEFIAASERTASVGVIASGLGTDGARFEYEVDAAAEVLAEGILEIVALPEIGFDGVGAICTDAGAEGEPFSCGALLDDGRLLEFFAFVDAEGGVEVAAANVLAPGELQQLNDAFLATIAQSGVQVEGARLDCGTDTVVLDTTGVVVCEFGAPGQVPIEVTVTVTGLGTNDEAYSFEFAELPS